MSEGNARGTQERELNAVQGEMFIAEAVGGEDRRMDSGAGVGACVKGHVDRPVVD